MSELADDIVMFLAVGILCLSLLGCAFFSGAAIVGEDASAYQNGVQVQSTQNLDVVGCQKQVFLSDPYSHGMWLAGCYDSIGK